MNCWINRHVALGAAAAVFVAAAPAFAETKSYNLSGFNSVDISAGLSAKIVAGGTYSVRAEAAPEVLDRLDIRVEGGVLVLGRKPQMGWGWNKSSGKVTIYVSAPKIDGVEASSGSSASATGIDAEAFRADVSSGASLDVSGVCGTLRSDASSGASLNARDLKCKSVSADASSGASISAYASERLDADASSGGSVSVKGGPKEVNTDRSSGGSVSVSE
jgi:hypothetical protein